MTMTFTRDPWCEPPIFTKLATMHFKFYINYMWQGVTTETKCYSTVYTKPVNRVFLHPLIGYLYLNSESLTIIHLSVGD